MVATKCKAVVSADREQWARVNALVEHGQYRTVSQFVREAMAEKLERLRNRELAEQVERYCEAGHAAEDAELIGAQAFSES